MKIIELNSQVIKLSSRESPQLFVQFKKSMADITQIVQPNIPAVAPTATSAAFLEPSNIPVIIIAATITAGNAAKIPAKDFHGITCNSK